MKILLWRWAFFLFGLLVMALGVTMTIKGHRLGVGPWDVLHIGLFKKFGLTIGTWNIIAGLIIITTTAIMLKRLPKIGTWLNLILIGAFIDMFNWLIPEIETPRRTNSDLYSRRCRHELRRRDLRITQCRRRPTRQPNARDRR